MSGTNTSEAETENRIKDYKIAQLALRLEGTSISSRHFDSLDPDFWGQPVTKSSSAIVLTTYAVKLPTDWEEYKEHGEDLFLFFKEESADWTSEIFSKIKSPFEKRFRDYFHNNGVYTGKKATKIGIPITNLLNAEELREWSQVTEENVSDQSQLLPQPTVMRKQTIRESSEDQSIYSKATTSRQKTRSNFRPIRSRSPYPRQND
ncbi:Bgt-51274 [Blumeria graminis f. sp. tritici]|uniref:Bgt-51274 n=1 Tax=Blumeria graminis f. sp. tritici TaxID=62690 RepID=A0A9X9L807_BLUGR|nr:hypothetical protein BGT96224_A20397 [Blumeria graminis f. sp. tritici 96224]VCU39086.1 Bgt-51274 [Blumeria graminis f. sp. tritici]